MRITSVVEQGEMFISIEIDGKPYISITGKGKVTINDVEYAVMPIGVGSHNVDNIEYINVDTGDSKTATFAIARTAPGMQAYILSDENLCYDTNNQYYAQVIHMTQYPTTL
jgi:hypothetical protein